jgi:hypothetical protein
LWLGDKEVISESKADEYFWFGLPKRIQKLLKQELGLDATIPPMKRAFKKACHVLKEMLEEDKDDLFGWPLIVGFNSAVEKLMDKGISNKNVQQELQGLKMVRKVWRYESLEMTTWHKIFLVILMKQQEVLRK